MAEFEPDWNALSYLLMQEQAADSKTMGDALRTVVTELRRQEAEAGWVLVRKELIDLFTGYALASEIADQLYEREETTPEAYGDAMKVVYGIFHQIQEVFPELLALTATEQDHA